MSLNLENTSKQKGFQSPNLGFLVGKGERTYEDNEHKGNKQ